MLNEKVSDLRFKLSEKSLQLLPEYHQKLDVRRKRERGGRREERKERVYVYPPILSSQVLKHFGFIKRVGGTVDLKGRVACEIHTHEVIITELLFWNFLSEFEPSEIAALLSCMVLQQVSDYM